MSDLAANLEMHFAIHAKLCHHGIPTTTIATAIIVIGTKGEGFHDLSPWKELTVFVPAQE
jgi:hypothetical protein